jgi:hypothetical protein
LRSSIPRLPSKRGGCFPTPETASSPERGRSDRRPQHRRGRRWRLRRCRVVGVAGHGRSCWRRSSSQRARHRGVSSEITRRRPVWCSRFDLPDRPGPGEEWRAVRHRDPPQQSVHDGPRQSVHDGPRQSVHDGPRRRARRSGRSGHERCRRIARGPRTSSESPRRSPVPA